MKTLYISDLDGTLFDKDVKLSDFTVETINSLIDRGLCFSVATARTAATCDCLLEKLDLNVPIVLMNGVLVYDLKKKKYIKKEYLTKDKRNVILSAMRRVGQSGFMYTLDDDTLGTYYEELSNEAMQEFAEERISKYGKKFTKTDSLEAVTADTIYFCYMDSFEKIHRLYDELKGIEGIRIEKYEDIYSSDGLWYMEVFCSTASKYNAVKFLRNEYSFEKVISFGDNLNDIPMFEASDESCAVANAKDAVIEKATRVIGANTDDGVARWILKNYKS